MDKNELHHKRNKMFFIIEKERFLDSFTYSVHKSKMYDLTTAVKKMLALDTLNEDNDRYSYHLQEVSFSMVTEPLVLTDEVKNSDQGELPF